jgi:ribokinase
MIVVFGSMNIDFLAKSAHLPQEGETVITSEDYLEAPGGKGMNQAVAAARAGATVKMAGKVGNDAFGEKVRNILKEERISTDLLQSGDKKTALAFIFVDQNGRNQIVVASGANMEAAAQQVPDQLLNDQMTLVMQMEVPPEENWKLLARAKKRGARTILNVAPAGHVPEEALKNLDYLIVNEIEAQQIASSSRLDVSGTDYKALAQSLSRHYGLTCIITLGKDGAIAVQKDLLIEVPALPLTNVVDTTGAGDSFCGNFAAAIDAGHDLREALKRASIGGSLACLKMGAQTALPYQQEIQERTRMKG